MREYKFRQFLTNGQFFYWGFINGNFISPVDFNGPSTQDTNLKDKKDSRIFEGDCLGDYENEQWVCYGIVEYDDYNGRYFLSGNDGYATDYETYDNSDWNKLEIIGNIYENPKLLENS